MSYTVATIYLAVTRAKHRCYLVWGAFKDAGISPLDVPPEPPTNQEFEILIKRPWRGEINKEWKVSSFSSLANQRNPAEQPDYDDIRFFSKNDNLIKDKTHIFNFPRGARAGQFMHSLFEKLDFQQPSEKLINHQLSNFGYDVEQWQTTRIPRQILPNKLQIKHARHPTNSLPP